MRRGSAYSNCPRLDYSSVPQSCTVGGGVMLAPYSSEQISMASRMRLRLAASFLRAATTDIRVNRVGDVDSLEQTLRERIKHKLLPRSAGGARIPAGTAAAAPHRSFTGARDERTR